MTADILTVSNLKKHFVIGQTGAVNERKPITVKAVDGISFTVREGETLGLVGESGSGKSTVAYITIGMYQPTYGSICFRGQDLFAGKGKRSINLQKAIQIVYQDPGSSLNPRQNTKQILEMPLRVHKPAKNRLEQIVNLLEIVGLPPEYMYKYPRMLSGGEKQIVAIARALATDPSLVILDEPTSALDVSVQAKTITLLLELQKDFQLSYLFITHDLSLMRNVSNRVAIMYLGKICEVAETVDFFRSPLHPYTQMLLSSIPVITREEEELKPKKVISTGEIPSPVDIPPGCSFHSRCPFVMDICKRVDPAMVEAAPGHSVRCHLYYQHEPAVASAGEVAV
jgi:peptide/nickel transport system ATP-binding protein